jgi:hypothetical protein
MATLYQDDQGNWFGRIRLDWDDNAELDLDCYVVECRKSDETRWRSQRVTASEAVFEGLAVGGSYFCRVKAVDKAGNESAYANFNGGSAISIPVDTFAPATPSGLVVSAAKKSIKIKVNRNTDRDWAGNEFHVSTKNGFTPSAGTLVHSGKTTSFVFHTTSYVTHYVKVRAYDTASTPNYSAYTAQGSATPEKVEGAGGGGDVGPGTIDTADLKNLAVTTAKIDTAAITTAKIDNLAVTDAKIDSLSAAKITAGTFQAGVVYAGDIECSQIKAGTIMAQVSIQSAGTIGFVDGPSLYGSGSVLICNGYLYADRFDSAGDIIAADRCDVGYLQIDGTLVIQANRDVVNVGHVTPSVTNSKDCGTITKKWANVYCTNLHEGDHFFEERVCSICGKPFQKGEVLGYAVIDVKAEGTRAIPVHVTCAGKAVD